MPSRKQADEVTFENDRLKLRKQIDRAKRKKLKMAKGGGKQHDAPRPRELRYLSHVAFELANGDPLSALSAAVETMRVAEEIK